LLKERGGCLEFASVDEYAASCAKPQAWVDTSAVVSRNNSVDAVGEKHGHRKVRLLAIVEGSQCDERPGEWRKLRSDGVFGRVGG
jgi:hypothetical protein